jgi:uncharacterized protein YlxW (UPF0749 family)
MSDGSIWVLIPLAAIIGGTIIKLKHGEKGSRGSTADKGETVERLASLTAQNAAVQTKINDLESRVRTLEKIATDPSQRLAAEIERL